MAHALKRFRPLARRRLITCRPAFEAILARKPWVRFLFSFFGWYVRFMEPSLRKDTILIIAERFLASQGNPLHDACSRDGPFPSLQGFAGACGARANGCSFLASPGGFW